MKGKVMSNADYRKSEGISSSELKQLMKTPAHYRYWKDNPEETDSQALLFGRSAHKYVLETYDFYNEFEVIKEFKYGTKDDKAETQRFICQKAIELGKGAEWDSFIITNPKKEQVVDFYRGLVAGKDLITEEMFEQIDAMRNSAYATPFVSKLLSGEKELSFWGVDEETGLKIKARPDCITEWNGQHILIDYKTATDVENMKFCRDSIKYGYDLQLAMYRDILKQNTGHDYMVVIIAQEKKAPYVTNVFQLSENYLESGRTVYKEMLRIYKECSETGNWYGYMKDGISILGNPDNDYTEDYEESEE
jgi:hypothetical protein